ncbi:DUF1014-domain-containing protein [Biscogniauxia mediterranea]|nr:DUF1014-domain-containing protein [Biscogniauxia mediterranea]
MAGKKGGDNSKKAAGQARKAEAAASKAAAEDAKKASVEEAEWSKGAKSNARKEAEAAKKAEQARKKAEREALLAEEEKNQPSRAAPKNKKTAVKKTNRSLDLSQLDISDDSDKKVEKALNATGTDAALALFDVVDGGTKVKIDRHPEKRYPAALAAYEDRRMKEMALDGSGHGLRLNQRKKLIRDEFAKSPDNPFNQAIAAHNASQEEVEAIREKENMKQENWLTSN